MDKMKLQKKHNKYQNVAARVNSSLTGSRRTLNGENHSAGSRDPEEKRLERKSSAPELLTTDLAVTSTEKKLHTNKTKNNSVITGKEKKSEKENVRHRTRKSVGDCPPMPKVPLNLSFTKDNDDYDDDVCDNDCEVPKYRSKGIQTLDTDNLNGIYAEGVVRY